MSDYLWNKSGEPDPTIERLEDLLAAKRYEREPLRLPSVIPVRTTPATHTRHMYLQVAALAAGIVLALTIGVWIDGRHESGSRENVLVATGDARREAPVEDTGRASGSVVEVPEDIVERRSSGEAVGSEGRRVRRRTIEPRGVIESRARTTNRLADEPLRVIRLARMSRGIQTAGRRLIVAPGDAGERGVLAQLHEEQRLAKEQLMIAMRMTSAKLNIARNKTQVAHAEEGGSR
jgi:hypothetical protein